ncbi:103aa long hypothetical protein [Pyrococcus horikoshii OT3]|uniref:Uncharacterized protein n=1 Tax=Pyrococcus horikoshii (strain ATCC 700860 / DSM 12428 / JCM 9974 / NBRC 100139 / OT-3) TaxID=70601 RepID=O58671_PYRHO|nr:103aa long hypothetical protein [Pyrococcus horikoshii OT3]
MLQRTLSSIQIIGGVTQALFILSICLASINPPTEFTMRRTMAMSMRKYSSHSTPRMARIPTTFVVIVLRPTILSGSVGPVITLYIAIKAVPRSTQTPATKTFS